MKNKKNIRSISSISQGMFLACLALPLALTTTCASDSSRGAGTTFFIDVPPPIAAPASGRQAADRVIDNEIFCMALADTNTDYSLSASVDNGVVALDFASTNRLELQRMVNEMWQLRGVEQVKNERGVDLISTLAKN